MSLDAQVSQHSVGLDLVKIGEKVIVQAHGVSGCELSRQGHPIRQIAGDSLGVDTDGGLIDQHTARCGRKQPGRDFQQCGFAAAVGAQQPDQLAGRDGKLCAVQGGGAAIPFGQAVYLINSIHGLLLCLLLCGFAQQRFNFGFGQAQGVHLMQKLPCQRLGAAAAQGV